MGQGAAGASPGTQPVLLLIGSPMGAEGFVAPAAFHRPHGRDLRSRGAGRSKRADGASQTTVEEQADDLCTG
jgi:hypothetical protein